MKDYCVELKVCEGCGALILRAAMRSQRVAGMRPGLAWGATCSGCAKLLSEFPEPRERRRRGFEVRSSRRTGGLAVCRGGAR
jgi:hypothetical protein